jgi:zinc D-Ala-D-Ala carboxypeptidase
MNYRIKRGDTLSALSRKFGTSVRALAQANGIKNPNLIIAGATLRIGGRADSFARVGKSPRASQSSPDTFKPSGSAPTNGNYANGRIPQSALTTIGIGGHRLLPHVAQAFIALREAAKRDGINIGVTDSYRTYDQQVDLAQRKGLYKNGGLAATPGTSNHGLGRAVDVDTNAAGTAWLHANASRFGFSTIPREPWHWEYKG